MISKVLCSLQTAVLEKDITDSQGKILAYAGDRVIILPQTAAQAVLVEKGKSLAELWPSISREGHKHEDTQTDLADYQEQMIRLTDRLTKIELNLEKE